jgi:hypothetical protein
VVQINDELLLEIRAALVPKTKPFNGWKQTITIIGTLAILQGASYAVLDSRIGRHEAKGCHDKSCDLISRLDERSKWREK